MEFYFLEKYYYSVIFDGSKTTKLSYFNANIFDI